MNPPAFTTLADMLAFRAEQTGERIAFTFSGRPVTYEELWQRARCFAALLEARGVCRGDRVVIALPNGADFFTAFYGVQCTGGVAVPIFPSSDARRLAQIAAHCGAGLVVIPEERRPDVAAILPSSSSLASVPESSSLGPHAPLPGPAPGELAFLQYTSGSTGSPKGVMLTHSSLLKNVEQMIAGMEITGDDVFVSWLPAYHDMGLILMTLVPFYLGIPAHLLPTDLANVRLWLRTIESYGATFTAAPDFAYRLCIRYGEERVDISSLRVALDAAEPVRASTIQEFRARFHLGDVMTAGYGLAEAAVGVSMSRPGEPPTVDERGLVSVGQPFPEIDVRIMDGEHWLPAGEVGEISVRTPAACLGYYNDPQETQRLFGPGGFLRTGDLGYLDEQGRLYIVGRSKNIIKHAGETIAAQEVEEIADAVAGVRFSAAVGIDRGRLEGEQLYIFAEMRGRPDTSQCEEAVLQIVDSVHARLGFRPARVLLLRQHGIPRTYNGKIQHAALRDSYLSGQLREQGGILFPDY